MECKGGGEMEGCGRRREEEGRRKEGMRREGSRQKSGVNGLQHELSKAYTAYLHSILWVEQFSDNQT